MTIDNDRKHIVTNFRGVKKGGKAIDTDHSTITLKLNLNIVHEKPSKVELFNFRDKASQERFRLNTTETTDFSKCFMSSKSVNLQSQDWIEVLMTQYTKAFPKIRIRKSNIKC